MAAPTPTIAELARMFDHSLLQPNLTDTDLVAQGASWCANWSAASVCIKHYGVRTGREAAAAGSPVVASIGDQVPARRPSSPR